MVSTIGSFLLRLVWPLLLLWVSTHRFKKNPLEGGDDDDSIAKGLGPRVPMKIMGNKKRKLNCRRKKLIEKKWMSGLAMCSSGPKGQTQAAKPPQGRANSELRNVAPTSAARRRPQILLLQINRFTIYNSLEDLSLGNILERDLHNILGKDGKIGKLSDF